MSKHSQNQKPQYHPQSVFRIIKKDGIQILLAISISILGILWVEENIQKGSVLASLTAICSSWILIFIGWRRKITTIKEDWKKITQQCLNLCNHPYLFTPSHMKTTEARLLQQNIQKLGYHINHIGECIRDQEHQDLLLKFSQNFNQSFLPPTEINIKNIHIESVVQHCPNFSGNFWQYYPINGGKQILVIIGDCVRWGYEAGLIASTILGILKSEVCRGQNLDPNKLLSQIENLLSSKMQLSLTAALFEPRRELVRLASIGDLSSYKIPANLNHDLLPMNRPNQLRLGSKSKSNITERCYSCNRGDRFIFFSSGLINNSGPSSPKPWGEKRLVNAIHQARNSNDFFDRVQTSAFGFFGNKPLSKDVTAVSVIYK